MSNFGLAKNELAMITGVFQEFGHLREVFLYGSRAKGVHRPESDIDLALVGIDAPLEAQSVAEALDALPLPYRFDVKPLAGIKHAPLKQHIDRLGISIYRRP